MKNSALAGAGFWLAAGAAPRVGAASANEKLNVAVIGCGGRGASDLAGVAGENLVALCDVDDRQAAKSFEKHPKAAKFRDFRKMLDQIHGQLDAVVVATPDHTHAPAAAMAMHLGKHVYCEKPMTHSVYEARTLTELAAKSKLVTQLGTQIHAEANYRRVVEWVRAGLIGSIGEVHVWHPVSDVGGQRPKDTPPVPAGLDWDLWLGPAPQRPYHPTYLPKKWRGWWDFANGGLGDFFCHYVDLAFWALELKYPTRIEAEGSPVDPQSCAAWLIVRYEFPARGALPPVKLTWYDGGKKPAILADRGVPNWTSGVLLVGEKGMLLADYRRRMLLPEEKFADVQLPKPTIADSIGHHAEWIKACKTGGATTCNFAYSGPLTEAALLGTAAYRAGEPIQWDGPNLKAIGSAKVERFLRRDYRSGWTL